MKTAEYRTVDKSEWARGPWDDEPDKMQFPDEATGLPCLIVRGPMGALCGYVGVAEGHPAFGVDYSDVRIAGEDGEREYVDVHGGLTFADHCQLHQAGEARGIRHVPSEGEPDHVWWLGFDCAHAWDVMPAHSMHLDFFRDAVYRDVAFVRRECQRLAQQLAGMH